MTVLERKRLKTVNLFKPVNFAQNNALNNIVKLAVEICDAPMAILSLMGKDTQFIKCKIGIDIDESDRETSFCKHLLNTNEVLVIPDTLKDERFVNNPAVTSGLAIRFYAGAALISSTGYHVGSICVYDQQPRKITDSQQKMLGILAKQAMHLMELEISLILAEERNGLLMGQSVDATSSESRMRGFFNNSATCHTLLSRNLKVLDFNTATALYINAKQQLQIEVGKNMMDYLSKSFKSYFKSCFKLSLAGEFVKQETLVTYSTGIAEWWKISFEPITNPAGKVISVAYSAQNINEHKLHVAEILAQNKSLLNIAHIQSHEYRRPVASILGLMYLIKTDNYRPNKECLVLMEQAVEELDDVIKRVVEEADRHASKFSA